MSGEPRTGVQRRRDTEALLRSHNHLWLATASAAATPYLVPLSFAWIQERLVIATATVSPTARNLVRSGSARAGLGATDDVILMYVQLEKHLAVEELAPEVADQYARQSDWDPRTGANNHPTYFFLRPLRIDAWREDYERAQRTIMADGEWLPETG